jgi:hypothetical protein
LKRRDFVLKGRDLVLKRRDLVLKGRGFSRAAIAQTNLGFSRCGKVSTANLAYLPRSGAPYLEVPKPEAAKTLPSAGIFAGFLQF